MLEPSGYAFDAPAHEAVVEGVVRAVRGRRVVPPEAVADDVDDTGDDAPAIDPRHTTDFVGQHGLDADELGRG